MKLNELIEHYKSKYRQQNIANEISEDIQKITYVEYEEYYKKQYGIFLREEQIDTTNLTLGEINDYVYEDIIGSMFEDEGCIFTEFDKDGYDFNFYLDLNTDEAIKSILDEKAEHGLRDNGNILSSCLSSVCQWEYYEDNINSIDMYALTWLKLNTTHPFKNGNKRTSFIGVKSNMIVDLIINWMDSAVNSLISSFESDLNKWKNDSEYIKKLKRRVKYWRKPSDEDIQFVFNSILETIEDDLWDQIRNNENIMKIIDNVSNDIVTSIANEISPDYILSIFIAKTTADEYKENNNYLQGKVLEILKADLIFTIAKNINYINSRIYNIQEEIKNLKPDELLKEGLVTRVTKHLKTKYN